MPNSVWKLSLPVMPSTTSFQSNSMTTLEAFSPHAYASCGRGLSAPQCLGTNEITFVVS
jgi:hypothetical protein